MAEFAYPHLEGLTDAYDRDGYAIIRGVLDPDLIAELDAHIEWLRDRHPDLKPEELGHWLIAEDPFWVRFISDDRLLNIAQEIVGPDIAFFAADYICKAPGTGRPVIWHQDATYWPLNPMEVVTFWFAVSNSGPENGGVRVVPGSHKAGLLAHVESAAESRNVLNREIDPEKLDEDRAVDLVLAPGDISIHNPYTLHGSEPNKSDRWRRGGSIQYMPATTEIGEPDWPSAFLLRGTPVEGINTYRSVPKYVEGEHMPFRGCEDWA